MNANEIKSLSEKTRNDGARLFGVSEFIYTCAIIFGWIIGIIGGLLALITIFKLNFWAGMGIALLTAIFCFANYIIAVLTTHVAKVLVHTSYSNIGILESLSQIAISNQEKNAMNSDSRNNNNWANDFKNQQPTSSTTQYEPKVQINDTQTNEQGSEVSISYSINRREVLEKLTNKGYLVNSIEKYPNEKFKIMKNGVLIKQANTIEELISFSNSIINDY
jgi:hypothetical protein